MEKLYLFLLSTLFTLLVGMIAYWFKTAHKDFKQITKELTDYTNQLKHLIVGIQTQIDKSIETDIVELKNDIKTLYNKTNKHDAELSAIQKK